MDIPWTADLVQQLRDAAHWIDHEMDPAPDWDGLLLAAANEIEQLRNERGALIELAGESIAASIGVMED